MKDSVSSGTYDFDKIVAITNVKFEGQKWSFTVVFHHNTVKMKGGTKDEMDLLHKEMLDKWLPAQLEKSWD